MFGSNRLFRRTADILSPFKSLSTRLLLPGNGGATEKWYWRSNNLEPIREEAILLPGKSVSGRGDAAVKMTEAEIFRCESVGNANSDHPADNFANFNK